MNRSGGFAADSLQVRQAARRAAGAHIGVIHALADAGIKPDLICGTSIGARVVLPMSVASWAHWKTGVEDILPQLKTRLIDAQ